MGKKLAGEASAEELQELEKLIRENPELVYDLQIITDFWKAKQKKLEATSDDPLLKRIQHRIKNQGGAPSLLDRPIIKKKSLIDRGTEAIVSFAKRSSLLANYFKLSWRTLMKNKAFSFINVTGLAVGMASAVIISLWILNDLSTEQFHSKKDRIYMMLNKGKFDGHIAVWGATPHTLGPAMVKERPDLVEQTARSGWVAAFVLKNGDKVIQTQGLTVDSGFLDIFDFPLIAGNYKTALHEPQSILITEDLAKRLFGKEEALNRTIRIDSTDDFKVTGILKNLPNNTDFTFEYLVPWSYREKVGWVDSNWNSNSIGTYVLLKPGITVETANNAFQNFKKQHDKGVADEMFLFSIKDWWLRWSFDNGEMTGGGRITVIRLFSIIVVFILIIACINYMNLSTARSEKRAREVGIRKVMGAHKASLVARFLGESILISFIAGIIALIIVQFGLISLEGVLTLPGSQTEKIKRLNIPYGSLNFWLAALGFIFITGILAGVYPAFYLSGYKPISVLQKTYKKIQSFFTFRKVLVVFQFSFAIILIICTIIIYRQIEYGKLRDPGYKQDDLAFVYVKGDMRKNYELIKKELFAQNLITDIIRTNSPVTDVWVENDDYHWRGMDSSIRMSFSLFEAEDRIIDYYGFSKIAGRDFDVNGYPSDSTGLILTESAVRQMGFKNPVGELITNSRKTWHVVGVVKDFIPEGTYDLTYPIIIHFDNTKQGFGVINFKLNPDLPNKDAKEKITAVFKKLSPGYAIEYRRIEDEWANKFIEEIRIGKMNAFFASLAIFISCLGLFALAAYTAETRIKEIGIRKVLGASVTTITGLLSKEFLKLVFIAFIIGSPIAWWMMHNWLKTYPYHVEISWWIFVITGLLSLLIAFISVGYQAIKAALANPVKSLKTE
jgi:ABC-type antimicrobial peptide transport system permease subunit